jgi:predicted AlkP superfamily pyrophosphatase or phosphodiesterase
LVCAILAAALLAITCARSSPGPTLLLLSFDGFRWDYVQRYPTPEIQRLLARGAHAEALIPPFPTKTYPSHYTTVTGLYPEHHGIVGNTMYDPGVKAWFSIGDRTAVEDGRWWAGEPIWVTGERQGRVMATVFWPGSEAPIGGARPRYWLRYDARMPPARRIDTMFGWLDKPAAERPSFVAMYFGDADEAGHDHGPDSPAVRQAVERLDRALGRLRQGLERRGLADEIDLILTSDHGMTELSPDRVIFLDDYLDLSTVTVVDWSPVLLLSARDGDNERVYRQLARAGPQLAVYRRMDLPDRLHFRDNPRITPIVAIASEGWTITSRARTPRRGTKAVLSARGNHGYDNALASMRGILIAAGPAFKRGATVPPVENVHLYEMMCRILGLKPAPNDGSPGALRAMLSAP